MNMPTPPQRNYNYPTSANDTSEVQWKYLDRMVDDWVDNAKGPLEELNLDGVLEFFVYELNMDLSMLVIAMINADQMNFAEEG